MNRFSRPILIAFSGALWFFAGIYLLPLGIHFLVSAAKSHGIGYSFFDLLSWFHLSSDQAAMVLVAAALGVGYFKSKVVFSKAVERGVKHIASLPELAPIQAVFTSKYLVLIGIMMGIGMAMKWLGVPYDIRGFIDVAVGSALINGSVMYFRKALEVKSIKSNK